ncbi:MAG: OmpA/MotB family protein [Myxococcota bacterium]
MSNLEAEITAGEVQVGSTRAGIQVNLSEEVLFDEGSAQLDDVGREVLFRLAQQLLEITDDIEVQGHTDDQPISPELAGRYPSNWELAGARAGEVVRLLEGVGIESDRLTARSFGETRPIASNETEDGRRRNRRIELRILRGADG